MAVMRVQPELTTPEDLRLNLAAVTSDFNRSSGIPPACYADDALLELERRAIFLDGWVGIGPLDRWQNSGDYTTLEIAGEPLILLRDREGVLRAFANSCRHRGSQLLEGSGSCRKIRCPFHWWTYDLEGRLKVYPRMESAAGFDPAENGLVEFPVASRNGLAFVSLVESPPGISDWLGDFDAFHSAWRLDDLVTTRVREFDVPCNWKTFIEVFNEYYHLPSVHPDSINWLYPEPDPVDEVSGEYTTQFGATAGAAALMADDQSQALPVAAGMQGRYRQGTRYTWIFPNLTFAASQDSLWMYQAYPLSAERSHIVQTIAFPSASLELEDFASRAERYYARIDAALDEDLPFLEKQQRGLKSRFARPGRFAALEPSVGRFAWWYSRRMLAQLEAVQGE